MPLMRLFARPKRQTEKTAAVPPGALIYAVGDIHGRVDLLQQITETIFEDLARHDASRQAELIFVGDYVDRGPDSAAVIDHLIALKNDARIKVHTLKGNHEEAVLSFLDDAATGPIWAEFGGVETLASYNVAVPEVRSDIEGWETARRAFIEAIPQAHVDFLRALDLYRVVGDYVFVHAGLKPGVPLVNQSEQDLLWIRGEFLEATRPFEKVVVYGHTPRREALLEPGRIGIDTGAYITGVLTALKLEGESQALLQTSRVGAGAPASRLRTA